LVAGPVAADLQDRDKAGKAGKVGKVDQEGKVHRLEADGHKVVRLVVPEAVGALVAVSIFKTCLNGSQQFHWQMLRLVTRLSFPVQGGLIQDV
jgi:hypothetical protein